MRRAGVYVDGFNFYHAVDDIGQPHLKWMCYRCLARQILRKGDEIELIKFFTAYPGWKPDSHARHTAFCKALEAADIEVILGQFKALKMSCRTCRSAWLRHEEKESDVNIALHLLEDVLLKRIDVAYVITTDSDIAPAVKMAVKHGCEVITVNGPNRRHSKEILAACGGLKATINAKMIQSALFPDVVQGSYGPIGRPSEYDPPS